MTPGQSTLRGPRLELRPMRSGDQAHFHQWLSEQPELREMIDDHRLPSREDQDKWFRRSQEPDRRFFSIVTLEDDGLIGNIGFVDIDPAAKTAQFRITIGNPEARGKGFGREAMELLLRYGFGEMGLMLVYLRVLRHNERALNMYGSMGLRVTQEYPASENSGPVVCMEIDAATFSALHS